MVKSTTDTDKIQKFIKNYYKESKSKRETADIRMIGDDDAMFNFGKYTGYTVKEVIKNDFQYLEWVFINLKLSGKIKKLIKNIMEEATYGFGDNDDSFSDCYDLFDHRPDESD